MSVGIYGGTQVYEGDFNSGTYSPLAGMDFNLKLTNNGFLSTNIEVGKLSATNNFESNLLNINLKYRYIFLPLERFTPTFNIGAGMTFGNSKSSGLAKKEFIAPNICSGLGVEYMFSNNISVSLVGNYIYYLSDAVDGKSIGKFNDSSINFNLGLRYYFN